MCGGFRGQISNLRNREHLEVQKTRQAGRMIFLRRAPFIALSFLPHEPRDYLLRCTVSLHRTRALKGPFWISIWSTFQKLPPSRGRKENYASVLSPKYEVFCRRSVGCFSRRERSAHI